MRTRRSLAAVLLSAATVAVGVAACGGPPPPPPPTVVNLTLKAAPTANADASGTPKPVRVRVLQLKTPKGFAASDFFTLDADTAKALGKDLAAEDEVVLTPGQEQPWTATLEDGVRHIGVMASYYAVDRAQWRAWTEVPPNKTTALVADVGADGVKLGGAGK